MESRLRAPSQNAEYSSVNAPWTYFFSPAGPDRSVVSSNPATAAAVIRVRISRTTSAARTAACAQARMDEPGRHGGAGHVGDQLPAPLHRDMLEDDQVNGQGTQPRPDGQGRIRHARRAGRDMRPAAGAARLVQVVLDPLRRRHRDLLLLIRPRHAQVSGIRQVPAARALALRVMVLGPVRDLPRHRRTRAARLLPPLPLLLRPLRGPPLLPGILRPGRSSEDGGIEEFPLFRDPARSAAASRSRRSATSASSAAIRSACAAISASRGSADGSPGGGASVTARNDPGNHAQPPRQHRTRRQDVTRDHAAPARPPRHLPATAISAMIRATQQGRMPWRPGSATSPLTATTC